jgi:hypothetical protein
MGTTQILWLDLSHGECMADIDDFRFRSHELLVELDAATTKMMMVVSKKISGSEWDEAAKKHHEAYEAWSSFLKPAPPLQTTSTSSYRMKGVRTARIFRQCLALGTFRIFMLTHGTEVRKISFLLMAIKAFPGKGLRSQQMQPLSACPQRRR